MMLTLQVPGMPAIKLSYVDQHDDSEPHQWFHIIKAGPTSTTYKCWTDNLVEFDMELRHGTLAYAAMGRLSPSAKSPFSIEVTP